MNRPFSAVRQSLILSPQHPEIILEAGLLARQADGSVLVKQGNLALLATVCASTTPREGQFFFPLSVDYIERFAAAGRIPGSFHRREGKLSDYEVLVSRLVDRALRPLFPEDYLCDVQVIITLLSSDGEILPDALAGFAASAALTLSDIPIQEPISEVRVSKIQGAYVVNPTRTQLKEATMDFIVAASKKNLIMVEGEAKECSEEELVEALGIAHEAIRKQIEAQEALRDSIGAKPKRAYAPFPHDEELKAQIRAFCEKKILDVATTPSTKIQRSQQWKDIKTELSEHFATVGEDKQPLVEKYFDDLQWELVRQVILDERKRLDGRALDEIRPIDIRIDYLPTPHGCALFTRGETQSFTTVTLGTSLNDLLIETAHSADYTKFILHYNFPAYSTGEIKPLRSPGRREVGHGNLALRSLKQMMPPETDNPYTVRVVSDIFESNGSSSMATVCAGSLALMDAGIQYREHVAGIAMGLISRSTDKKYAILTDILGDEDHLGDMDFKVTGTRKGICGVQMDMKIDGLESPLLYEALLQAKHARLHILDKMYNAIGQPRTQPKPHAPRMEKIIIDTDLIGAVIGPGGKVVQDIQKRSGATVTIEEKDNKGEVFIFATNEASLKMASDLVKAIVEVPEVGKVYPGIVKSVQAYGAFVDVRGGR